MPVLLQRHTEPRMSMMKIAMLVSPWKQPPRHAHIPHLALHAPKQPRIVDASETTEIQNMAVKKRMKLALTLVGAAVTLASPGFATWTVEGFTGTSLHQRAEHPYILPEALFWGVACMSGLEKAMNP